MNMSKIKIYLDDKREAPYGWIQCRWPNEVIEFIKKGNVEIISLDHDLGGVVDDNKHEITGMDVLNWLEQSINEDIKFMPPTIIIHTQNAAKFSEMKKLAHKIHVKWVDNYF